jgi:hypothetical protein
MPNFATEIEARGFCLARKVADDTDERFAAAPAAAKLQQSSFMLHLMLRGKCLNIMSN